MPTTNPRIWITLTPAEAASLEACAEARGIRPNEMVRQAVLAVIAEPARQPGTEAVAGLPGLAGLDALVAALGRHVADLDRLVPATEDALAERDDARATLQDIAYAVGIMAGSLEPDDGGVAAFGPDR
jgi:hypothetical protein